MTMKRISPRPFILLICMTVVIALTTLPATIPAIHEMKDLSSLFGHPDITDALGHGSLYGILTGVIFWALRKRLGFTGAFWTALGTALLLGLSTELFQHFSPGRTMQLSDLLGNWLGAMTAAALIGFYSASARR